MLPGPGQPMRNMTNMPSQPTQPRNTTPGSRLITSKLGAWGSSNAGSQPQESGGSWAQAMNPRSNNQLDLSSSSFPSLAGGNGQSHTAGVPSSQWQAGPPPREQSQQPNPRTIQQRQPPIQNQREQNFGNDFSAIEQPSTRYQSHSNLPRGAPPGLAPVDTMSPDSSIQSRKSPIGQTLNGSIGQERTNGEKSQSPASALAGSGRSKDGFPVREGLSPSGHHGQSMEAIFNNMSEKDKWGMAGWQALNDGPDAEFKAIARQQDLAAFENHAASGQSLLRSYSGPFAPPNSYVPRPLDTDFTIPDCYIVHNVAPINQRISGFTEDTLFYIFYTSPKDIIQEEVATELMSRKWRFHMKEKMWLTRDDTTQSPQIIEKDVSEQGYYIWWDPRNWKRVRRLYNLRYDELDDHLSGGRSLPMPGLFQGGFGMVAGVNGGNATAGQSVNNFNAVPGLERMAALGGRF